MADRAEHFLMMRLYQHKRDSAIRHKSGTCPYCDKEKSLSDDLEKEEGARFWETVETTTVQEAEEWYSGMMKGETIHLETDDAKRLAFKYCGLDKAKKWHLCPVSFSPCAAFPKGLVALYEAFPAWSFPDSPGCACAHMHRIGYWGPSTEGCGALLARSLFRS